MKQPQEIYVKVPDEEKHRLQCLVVVIDEKYKSYWAKPLTALVFTPDTKEEYESYLNNKP